MKKTVTYQYEDRQLKMLKIICDETQKSKSQHLRDALDMYIEHMSGQLSRRGIYIFALELAERQAYEDMQKIVDANEKLVKELKDAKD